MRQRRARRSSRAALAAGCLLAPGLLGAGIVSPAASAGDAAQLGQWSAPFEEGGSATPRCTAPDDKGFTVCKPAANAASVLPDGRVFYYMGLEGHEDQQR